MAPVNRKPPSCEKARTRRCVRLGVEQISPEGRHWAESRLRRNRHQRNFTSNAERVGLAGLDEDEGHRGSAGSCVVRALEANVPHTEVYVRVELSRGRSAVFRRACKHPKGHEEDRKDESVSTTRGIKCGNDAA